MLYKPCVMQGFEALAHVAEGSPPCILHSINPMCQATLLRHPFGVPLARDELRLLIEQKRQMHLSPIESAMGRNLSELSLFQLLFQRENVLDGPLQGCLALLDRGFLGLLGLMILEELCLNVVLDSSGALASRFHTVHRDVYIPSREPGVSCVHAKLGCFVDLQHCFTRFVLRLNGCRTRCLDAFQRFRSPLLCFLCSIHCGKSLSFSMCLGCGRLH
jgi:hypothetical protein|eukprot:jgi/Chrpa1/17452/Chrysochromulina_OHIO_Genome00007385-RA